MIRLEAGLAYFFAGDYDRAAAICQRAVVADPVLIFGKTVLAAVYTETGRYSEAIKEAKAARALPDGDIPSVLAELG